MDLQGKRAARVLRVSTTGQDEDNQDKPTAGYIATRGMLPGKTYKLHGKSARKGQQVAAVRQAIADYRAGEYDVLVVRAVDRLDRRGAIAGWALIAELWNAGVILVSAADPELENAREDAMAEMSVSIKLSMARLETDGKTRRLADAFRDMDADGSFRGCPPAGYLVTGDKYAKRLVPDPVRGQLVADAIADAGRNASTTVLGKRLGMTPDAVSKLIRNRVYSTGRYEIRRADGITVIKRTDALVPFAVQKLAIDGLARRRTGDNLTSRAIAKDDFSGALYCAHCGRVLYRYFGGGKKDASGNPTPRVRRYQCAKNRGGCGKSVHADHADTAVQELMSGRTAWWLDRQLIPGDDNSAEMDRVQDELDELPRRRLDRAAEQAERERLWARLDELNTSPGTPDRWEAGIRTDDAGNCLSEADRWASLGDHAARRAYLASGEFRVTVKSKPGRTGAVTVELAYAPDELD